MEKLLEYIDNRDALGIAKIVNKIKEGEPPKEYVKYWDVKNHKVNNKSVLPDKVLRTKSGEVSGVKLHNRIAVPYQKLVVNNSVSFGFGNDVQINNNADSDTETQLLEALKRVLHENKESTLNQKVARHVYSTTEAAELWYVKRGAESDSYGFNTEYRIRSMVMSSRTKDRLVPIFDDRMDMVAFARGYTVIREDGQETEAMTVWTDELVLELKKENSWEVESEETNEFGKIPIIYSSQDEVEWADVQSSIDRLELLLSKHAEINDYHAAPKTFVKGTLMSMPKSGEAGGILQGGEGTDVKILSWQNATDSVALEIETLITSIHKFTQTPDISFENMKGMSQASGVMLRMLFMDAHLKVARKKEIWDAHFTRRYNLIKRMINILSFGRFDEAERSLECSPTFTPYMIDDIAAKVDTLMTANGGSPLMSHRTSIEMLGIAKSVDAELEDIEAEESERFARNSSEPISLI